MAPNTRRGFTGSDSVGLNKCKFSECKLTNNNYIFCQLCKDKYHKDCAGKSRCSLDHLDNSLTCATCAATINKINLSRLSLSSQDALSEHSNNNISSVSLSSQRAVDNTTRSLIINCINDVLSGSLDAHINAIKSALSEEMESLRARVDTCELRVDNCESNITDISSRVQSIENNCSGVNNVSTTELFNEFKDIEYRSTNLMIFGIMEDSQLSHEDRLSADDLCVKQTLKTILDDDSIGLTSLDIVSIKRLGKVRPNKCRPLCIRMKTKDNVFAVLSNRSKLPAGVKVSTDKTRKQQMELHAVLESIKLHNEAHPNDLWSMKYVRNVPSIVCANGKLLSSKN